MAEKELLIVGGPNGSGKTTIVRQVLQERPLPYLGADEIAAELAAAGFSGNVNIEAGREFIRRIEERLTADESFIVESTLSGRSFRNTIKAAKSAGFNVSITFVFVDSKETSALRVRERVAKGGHDVPQSDIERRFLRSLENFWRIYRPLADSWFLFDNAGDAPRLIATGDPSEYTVKNDFIFMRFRRLIGE